MRPILAWVLLVPACVALGLKEPDTRPRLSDKTLYVPRNADDVGYSDELVSPLTYRVSFSRARTQDGARQGAFWHAAEIASSQGCSSFALLRQRDDVSVTARGGGTVCNTIGSSVICTPVRQRVSKHPGATIVVRLIRDDDDDFPDGARVLVTSQVLAEIPIDTGRGKRNARPSSIEPPGADSETPH